jgi:hypothetical protein
VPQLNREVLWAWLKTHKWSVRRLAEECTAIGEDSFVVSTMYNVVNGTNFMRSDRIKVICQVTAKYGDGVSYDRLVAVEPERHMY